MIRIFISIMLLSVLSSGTVFGQEPKTIPERINFVLPKIQVIPITDAQHGRSYDLYVKLPESYSGGEELRYPVIYYTDALWHIEMLSGTTEYQMENVILVGISWQKDLDNKLLKEAGAHVSRYRDYSIKPSSNPEYQEKYQFGHAKDHLAFIRNDVIPYIESNYRTAPNNRTYFGYSLGGEFGAYALLTQQNTFNNYILGSPSLKGEIPFLSEIQPVSTLSQNALKANIFVSYGNLEDELGKHTDAFISLLENKNDATLSLTHEIIEGTHQTAFPLTVVRSISWLSNLMKE
ncbi:alpha/beta hydrolase [Fulvivirga lutimaris]|uniref:alpha/beta hydrolase n=1 Tax=Fulvivirga lutimaris TaxID=1819566 RepID=UPI0012BD34B4|nr:alpha/beta hydrolase-fold protein [Fulvivirga lutimaris]MTI41650.1 alpha/beta hydrolase [Fulvivirga lutimaris]